MKLNGTRDPKEFNEISPYDVISIRRHFDYSRIQLKMKEDSTGSTSLVQ